MEALSLKNIQLDCKMVRNPRQASLTRDILLRDVKLFGFMKNIFNFAMSKPTVFVHILYINLNDVFFSSATLFLLC